MKSEVDAITCQCQDQSELALPNFRDRERRGGQVSTKSFKSTKKAIEDKWTDST